MPEFDDHKKAAALAAVELVESGMRLGLGTGSTAELAIVAIGKRLGDGRLQDVVGVATSEMTAAQAREVGIPLVDPWLPASDLDLDLAIDGADEIAPDLSLTKGHGGALLREKIVAAAARRFVVIADASKLVPALGSICALPLEVSGFATGSTLRLLSAWGEPRLRTAAGGPVTSDNGNPIVDLTVGPVGDVPGLDAALSAIPGVLGTGLFHGLASLALVADADGVREVTAR